MEEQLAAVTVDGKIESTILYEFNPIFIYNMENLDLKKAFEEVVIVYNTYTIELINCTIFRRNNLFYERDYHVFQVVPTNSNIVGMWHTLNWEI